MESMLIFTFGIDDTNIVRNQGTQSLNDRRHAEYMGGFTQGIPPLINSTLQSGLVKKEG